MIIEIKDIKKLIDVLIEEGEFCDDCCYKKTLHIKVDKFKERLSSYFNKEKKE